MPQKTLIFVFTGASTLAYTADRDYVIEGFQQSSTAQTVLVTADATAVNTDITAGVYQGHIYFSFKLTSFVPLSYKISRDEVVRVNSSGATNVCLLLSPQVADE